MKYVVVMGSGSMKMRKEVLERRIQAFNIQWRKAEGGYTNAQNTQTVQQRDLISTRMFVYK
jgi:hypothetical protein